MKIQGRFVVHGLELYANGLTVTLARDGESGGLESVGGPLKIFLPKGRSNSLKLDQKVWLTLDDGEST